MMEEEESKLGLGQTRCAEVISRGPVAEEGADTCTAAGDNGLADAVDNVDWILMGFCTLPPLLQN